MTIDEAIFCMASYLPEETYEKCFDCPYYANDDSDERVIFCKSSEAHRMAIEALKKLKEETK